MTLSMILLMIFNLLLWTVVRETLIEIKRRSVGWAGFVVLCCFITSLVSLALFA